MTRTLTFFVTTLGVRITGLSLSVQSGTLTLGRHNYFDLVHDVFIFCYHSGPQKINLLRNMVIYHNIINIVHYATPYSRLVYKICLSSYTCISFKCFVLCEDSHYYL